MSISTAPETTHTTRWDRAVVIALGGAGCALSYDALQQMAVAIHVRGLLTYLFPLVIDGFIAYGVRALLVLRDAPLRARLYVWTLFGTATAASIWANALHAVRLNGKSPMADGLRLGDTVVAVLSTIAPLALAGAVHLYILIARGAVRTTDRSDRVGQAGRSGEGARSGRSGQRKPPAGQVTSDEPVGALTDRQRPSLDQGHSESGAQTQAGDPPRRSPSDTARRSGTGTGADLPGQPVTSSVVGSGSVTTSPVPDPRAPVTAIRRPDPDTQELLKIAREAVKAEDKLTRKVVAQAIRGQQIPLSNDTLTALMVQLRQQHRHAATASPN